jgi:carbonic anhydrase
VAIPYLWPKRDWLAYGLSLVVLVALVGGTVRWLDAPRKVDAPEPESVTAESALAQLLAGNSRFVKSARVESTDTRHDALDRQRLAQGQHPVAAILCCADSRVCPEFIFDQRAGSIFEIRNAGNVVDEDVLASLEYAVEHCHVPLILVLGHEQCGAVQAVSQAGDQSLPEHLGDMQRHMSGIQKQLPRLADPSSRQALDALSVQNAREQALSVLRESRVIKQAVEHGAARLRYGIYHMESGSVEIFDL